MRTSLQRHSVHFQLTHGSIAHSITGVETTCCDSLARNNRKSCIWLKRYYQTGSLWSKLASSLRYGDGHTDDTSIAFCIRSLLPSSPSTAAPTHRPQLLRKRRVRAGPSTLRWNLPFVAPEQSTTWQSAGRTASILSLRRNPFRFKSILIQTHHCRQRRSPSKWQTRMQMRIIAGMTQCRLCVGNNAPHQTTFADCCALLMLP